jgi:hypothetical protein
LATIFVEDIMFDAMDTMSLNECLDLMRKNYDKKVQRRPKTLEGIFFDEDELERLENTKISDEDMKIIKTEVKDALFDILKNNVVYISQDGEKLTQEGITEILNNLEEFEKTTKRTFSKVGYLLSHLYIEENSMFDFDDLFEDTDDEYDICDEDTDYGEEAYDYDFDIEYEEELDSDELSLMDCYDTFYQAMMNKWFEKEDDFLGNIGDFFERDMVYETLIQKELDVFGILNCKIKTELYSHTS